VMVLGVGRVQKVGRGVVGCCSARGAFYRPGMQWRGGEGRQSAVVDF
jgi:hypothetical protein